MSVALNEQPIWMDRTDELAALHEKTVLLSDTAGRRVPATLLVQDADPTGPERGKCALQVWQTWAEGGDGWTNAGGTRPLIAAQAREWRRYLPSEAVVDLESNAEGEEFGQLFLNVQEL